MQSNTYAACVEYDGSGFSGWQAQKHNVRTVQGVVEKALSRVGDEPIAIITAGRTDTGVHATHQIIHFSSVAERTELAWCRGANRFLDSDVRIKWVTAISSDFHARFSALSRSYRFIIRNSQVKSAIHRSFSTHEYRKLDVGRMQEAGRSLVGEHDFSSFRASGCQAHSPIRTVSKFALNADGDWVWFDITANAFLQHMVRNIAGSLIEVGYGKREIDWFSNLLLIKDRKKAGITAEPQGLYLTGVEYPPEFRLPSNHSNVRFW